MNTEIQEKNEEKSESADNASINEANTANKDENGVGRAQDKFATTEIIITKIKDELFSGCETREQQKARKIDIAAVILCAVALVSLICVIFLYDIGISVYVDGEKIGSIKNRDTFDRALEQLEDEASDIVVGDYVLPYDVSFLIERNIKNSELTLGECKSKLLEYMVADIKKTYCLSVDGEFIASNPDKAVLEEAIAMLCESEKQTAFEAGFENISEVRIINDIAYSEDYCSGSTQKSAEQIFEMLSDRDHVLSNISDAEAPRPQSDSLIRYEYVRVMNETVQSPYETVYTDSPDHYIGYINIIKEGTPGENVNTYEITCLEDGTETDRKLLGVSVVQSPIAQKAVRGTKAVPTTTATGSFDWPCDSRVMTSLFGGRILMGAYDFHYGIDIDGELGANAYASDSGIVICAESQYSYGNIVMISHGSGYVTYYAHLDSFAVKEGDEVRKGDIIGYIGMTGNVTGPHLHFEVRLDGKLCDPFDYIDESQADKSLIW